MRFAVIDCGTNTFHLLIAEVLADGTYELMYRERQYVYLGEEGLDLLGEKPQQRGLLALEAFREKMSEMNVEFWRVIGTEALRRARNASAFLERVSKRTGLQVEVISGNEEARLIHLGVMQAVPPFEEKALIMDVGGGSVEFIISDVEAVYWSGSFPIGVQVLYDEFQRNDPISHGDILALHNHLDTVLAPLHAALRRYYTPLLIGASGSFEVIESMLHLQKPNPNYGIVSIEAYQLLYRKIVAASLEERLRIPGLPAERAKLIVVAFVLIDYIIRKANISQIIPSAFALKEGVLYEIAQKMRIQ